ncbi:MAG: LysR family transcriptional regulator [Humidesulfovibrio sp.]|uniref:winged helix-turn-helix domain-containing protein n=1 Tax=Humidesulfovibrio sp. TaxID=2910988 RepID=UPI0027F2CE5C|nr:LysR family transcriptional regulator [Humidesulfovibrio sp.]MDQ7833885.1 LysR family transcriptional regulator [Humidesulfovibrio sp.]
MKRKTPPAEQSKRPGKPMLRVHLWLESEDGMLFGMGRAQLLEMVALLGSLNQAAKALGMSYRAAWGRIKRTEEALGEKLLVQASGRKGYELTPLASDLVREFAAWHSEVEEFALKCVRRRLPWDIKGFSLQPTGQAVDAPKEPDR